MDTCRGYQGATKDKATSQNERKNEAKQIRKKKNEWASACRATSSEQFVSYIMATILFDEMIIINDYHASFVLESHWQTLSHSVVSSYYLKVVQVYTLFQHKCKNLSPESLKINK